MELLVWSFLYFYSIYEMVIFYFVHVIVFSYENMIYESFISCLNLVSQTNRKQLRTGFLTQKPIDPLLTRA